MKNVGKQKRVNKTKEELIKEAENKKEVSRKRDIVVNKFYPALIEATISVDEAKALVHVMGSLIMEEVLKTMKFRRFADITESLHNHLTKDGERSKEIRVLLESLNGENLFVAREIIEGMSKAIGAMEVAEMRTRNLSTLKADWESYLN